MIRYILSILIIISLASSTGCKKALESPLQFDSLDQSGGNLARFTIIGNYLCVVNGGALKVYNIQDPANPVHIGDVGPGATILSLRTFKDSLLVIGILTNASSSYSLNLYSFKNTPSIQLTGSLTSSQAEDPFTYKNNDILTTSRNGPGPSYYVPYSQLCVYDIKNLYRPDYTIHQNIYTPLDLSADGNNLFVCDSGLKVFDITDLSKIAMKKHFNIEAQNVLSNSSNLTILGTTGLFQYRYASDTINLLSKINIVPSH